MKIVYKINKDKTCGGRFTEGNVKEEWQVTAHNPKDYIKPLWSGTEWIESATKEDLKAHAEFQLSSIRNSITNAYLNKHQPNGFNYYTRFRENIILDYYRNKITLEKALEISRKLKPALNEIAIFGDWKDAINLLIEIEPIDIVIDEYVKKAIDEINEYIAANYEN